MSAGRGAAARMLQAACVALVAGAAASPADAAFVYRLDREAPVRACKAASDAFRAPVRFRPMAVANGGAADVFVTCGWSGFAPGGNRRASQFGIYVHAHGQAATVTCTAVHGSGDAEAGSNVYVTRTLELQAGYAGGALLFDRWQAGLPQTAFGRAQVSCMLSPGVELYHVTVNYEEDIGS